MVVPSLSPPLRPLARDAACDSAYASRLCRPVMLRAVGDSLDALQKFARNFPSIGRKNRLRQHTDALFPIN
jgi:hypothetical protein